LILLDTNICIANLNGDPRVEQPMRNFSTHLRIPAIVVAELRYGAAKSARRDENNAKLDDLLAWAPGIDFDIAAARIAGDVRAQLRAMGKPTGMFDLLIAATALRHDATLVTNNTRHFENIPNLKLDNWLR